MTLFRMTPQPAPPTERGPQGPVLDGVLLSELGADEVDTPAGKNSLVVVANVILTPGGDTTGNNAAAGTVDAEEACPTVQSVEEPDMVADGVGAAADEAPPQNTRAPASGCPWRGESFPERRGNPPVSYHVSQNNPGAPCALASVALQHYSSLWEFSLYIYIPDPKTASYLFFERNESSTSDERTNPYRLGICQTILRENKMASIWGDYGSRRTPAPVIHNIYIYSQNVPLLP